MPEERGTTDNYTRPNSAECNLAIVDELIDSPKVLTALSISMVVITIGIVGALLLFIWLSFQYPDRANILIPLVMTSLGTIGVANGGRIAKAVKRAINTNRNSATAIDSSKGCGPGNRQLDDDKRSTGSPGNN